MNLEISKYLKEYIQREFPMYCKAIENNEFMSFLGSIASNLKKYNVEAICNGMADKIIDESVDKYAQLKLPDIWNNAVFEYLSEHIQKNFPMYYKSISQKKFASFVASIASNPVFKERGLKAILAGETDEIIDELVDKYAQLKLTNIWANFSKFCDYIKSVIVKRNTNWNEKINEKTLDNIVRDIALNITMENALEYSSYMNGSFDEIFLTNFDVHCDTIFRATYNYIQQVISDSNIKVVYDKLTYEDLLEQVMLKVLEKHQVEEVINGLCDKIIIESFEERSKEKKNKIYAYIKSVIDEMPLLLGIPVNEVVDDITKMVCDKGELSASKLLSGDLDRLIEGYASRKRKGPDSSAAKNHIYQKLKIMNSVGMSDELLNRYTEDIFNILYHNHGFSIKSIEFGERDNLISNIFSSRLMQYNSLERKDVPKRIKHKPRRRKSPRILPMLLVTATLAGALYGGVSVVNEVVTILSNAYSSRKIDEFDDYDYSYIFTINNDAVEPTAANILDFYEKVKSTGLNNENYYYLGFYRAYENVRSDKLFIMDEMLDLVQDQASSNSKYNDFYKEIADDSCYLEFVIERLEALGCDGIKKEKYSNVLSAYKNAMWDRSISETPMDNISSDDKKIIDEIMSLYRKYCEKLSVDFVSNLSKNDTNVVSLSVRTGGRG